MRTKRSAISLSFREGSDAIDSQRHNRESETLETLFLELQSQIREIRRQMKQKVNRNEFVSSLSSKLSISQLASLNFANRPHPKQNICPNQHKEKNKEKESGYNKIQQQLQQLDAAVKIFNHQQYNQEVQALKQSQSSIIDNLNRQEQAIERLKEQLYVREEAEKQRLAEVEAYIYRKAQRSELEKLFTLNQLLVIQIEQTKQKSQQSNRDLTSRQASLSTQHEALLHRHRELEKALHGQISEKSSEIDRILGIVESKYGQREGDFLYFENSVRGFQERLRRLEGEENLSVKELTTRINILELKESHISKAAKEVDLMRNQMDVFKMDIVSLHERAYQVSANVRQFVESSIRGAKAELEQKLIHEIELTCQEIMKKVIGLTDDLASPDHLQTILNPLKQKTRNLQQSLTQTTKKLEFLDRKQRQLEQTIEEEIQKSEERASRLTRQLNNYVGFKQFNETMGKYVKIEELRDIGKEIDRKVEKEIERVVVEQDKINQVICSENIMGKWFWTNSATKGGNLVSWDRQIVNTLPQNFKWTKTEPIVLVSKGGYYRLQLGFYSKKKPTVQIIINGQTIVSAVNTSSYVLHHSSGKLKDVSNSEIAGLTYIDYLLLPDEARIAISYLGEFTGQGFLSIHRI